MSKIPLRAYVITIGQVVIIACAAFILVTGLIYLLRK